MDTPEEVLEATLRLKWPGLGLDWQEVIRTVMGFGDLLRLPEDMKRRRRKQEAAAEPNAAPDLSSMRKGERVEYILRHATEPISSGDIARKARCSAGGVLLVAKRLGAQQVGKGGATVWLPLRSGARTGAEPKPRRGGQMPVWIARVREMLEEEPLSMSEMARRLRASKNSVRNAVLALGAKRIGERRHTKWTLSKGEVSAA